MGLNLLKMTAAIWLLSGVLACSSAHGMVQPLEANLPKLAQWKSSGKALICAERTTTKPGKANILGNDACPLDFSTGLPQTLLQESFAPVVVHHPAPAPAPLATAPAPDLVGQMQAQISGQAASAPPPAASSNAITYPKCNYGVKCTDEGHEALRQKCNDAVTYKTKRFNQINTQTTGDKLIKSHDLRIFRDCATGINDAEQLSNQQKKPFLSSSSAVLLCEKLSCQDLEAIVKTNHSLDAHHFSKKTAPASMLAVDVRLEKTQHVFYCQKQYCEEKKERTNKRRELHGLKKISLEEIKTDCDQCNGSKPRGDCHMEQNRAEPGCNSSCQCFKYETEKVCEIYDAYGKNPLEGMRDKDVVEAKFGSGGLMQNTGVRDLCAMI